MKNPDSDSAPPSIEALFQKYSLGRFKRDISEQVSLLVLEKGMNPKAANTVDAAGNAVARKKGGSRNQLAWVVIRTELLLERVKNQNQFHRDVSFERCNPGLPGFEKYAIDTPEAVLIDQEVVKRGDPRMTLQIVTERNAAELDIATKERAAHEQQARERASEEEKCRIRDEEYRALAGKFWEEKRIKPEDVIYDKKKGWSARPGAKVYPR